MGDRARFCGSCGAELTPKAPAFLVEQATPGTVLKDRYKLVRALPARGAARQEGNLLWEAQDGTTGGRVQIQLLPRALTDDATRVAELKRVCELWQKADHAAIVRLERLEFDPVPFLVLEHVDAISFEELLASRGGRDHGPFQPEELATLLPPVGEALDALYDKGLVHGAVEPGHLLVPDARTGPATRVTHPGVGALLRASVTKPAGGPGYTAPEQGGGRGDQRSDVYALALTIAQLLTGRHPLQNGGVDLSGVPATVRAHLERGLAAQPDARPASPGKLVREVVEGARHAQKAPPPAEPTMRMVPVNMTPASMTPAKADGVAQAAGDGAAKVGAPDARAALRAPAPPAPAADFEKTIRFVPGMIDESLAAPPAKAPPPPPAPKPPPPPPPPPMAALRAAPLPAPPQQAETEKTIRFVPGMNDTSLAPAPQKQEPPPAQQAAPQEGQPGPEPGGATFEWVLIVALGLIALWQLMQYLR